MRAVCVHECVFCVLRGMDTDAGEACSGGTREYVDERGATFSLMWFGVILDHTG